MAYKYWHLGVGEKAGIALLHYGENHQFMKQVPTKTLPIGFQCLILQYEQRSTNTVESLYHKTK